MLLAELLRLTATIARAAEAVGDARRAAALLQLRTQKLEGAYAAVQSAGTSKAPSADHVLANNPTAVPALPPELEQIQRQMQAQRGRRGPRRSSDTPRVDRLVQDRRYSPDVELRESDTQDRV